MMMINIVFILRQMQALKRMEHALTTNTEQLEHTQSIYNELQAQVTGRPTLLLFFLKIHSNCVKTFLVCRTSSCRLETSKPHNVITCTPHGLQHYVFTGIGSSLGKVSRLNQRCGNIFECKRRGASNRHIKSLICITPEAFFSLLSFL